MREKTVARLSAFISATCLAAVVAAMPVLAAADMASAPIREPDHPLPPGCGVTDTNSGTLFEDAEEEPYIDVDRSTPATTLPRPNVIAVFQQDRWSNGGSHGLMTDVSHDGGTTFHALSAGVAGAPGNVPAFDRCTGGTAVGFDYERSSDPWVSIAPNGDAYQIAISFDVTQGGFGGPSSVLVSKSPAASHGETWQVPQALRQDTSDTVLNDKESITADPNTSNNVYAVWDRLVSPSESAANRAFTRTFAYRGPTWFSRTTDAGASWTPGRIIFDPGEKDQTIGNQIVVTPAKPSLSTVAGDEVVDGFDLINNFGGNFFHDRNAFSTFTVAVLRSANQGASWSGPVVVSPFVFAPAVVPSTGKPVRGGEDIPEFAADRSSGVLYAVWMDGRYTGKPQINLSLSKDAGASWSAPVRVNDPSADNLQTFLPQVHVADDGTVGVSYYQLDDNAGTTTIHLVQCNKRSADCTQRSNWSANGQTQVGGPFNITTAPYAEGYFVGDYQGLTDFGTHGFRPFFVMSAPPAVTGRTDPFSNTVCPAGGC